MNVFRLALGIVVGVTLGDVGLHAADAAPAQNGGALLVDGDSFVKNWTPPEYPAALQAEKIEGEIVVHGVIDENGAARDLRVVKSPDPRFNDPLLAALQKASYGAAVHEGHAVPDPVELRWKFSLTERPKKKGMLPDMPSMRTLPVKRAIAEFSPDPEYPSDFLDRRLNGEVAVEFEIDPTGAVGEIKVLGATHPAFVKPALDAVRRWKFKPATQGENPVKEKKRASLSFEYESKMNGDKTTTFQANGLAFDKPDTVSSAEICDKEPALVTLAAPVFPLELLSAGKPGEVDATFTINERGLCENIVIAQATTPSCGAAVAAALEATVFKPALRDGQAVAVKMKRHYEFTLPAQTAEVEEPAEARLLRALRAGETIPGPKGIDGKLKPIWRAMPIYPATLRADGPDGVAEIEFVIDQAGRARVPKIVSTTRDEFGWAAATAIAQWVFEAPTRNGQPADVRVKIPVKFSPPAK